MKVLSTEGLSKLIQLIKSAFISVDDTVSTTEIDTVTTSELTLATVATSGSYNDLSNKPTIPTVPTNVSAFTNDSGYITSSALTGYATQSWVGQQGYITGITSSDVTTALGYTPLQQSDLNTILDSIYPVGSIYIGTQSTCPMASLISGSTWQLVTANKSLWTGDGTNANTTIAAGLPNITGEHDSYVWGSGDPTGAFTNSYITSYNVLNSGGTQDYNYMKVDFNASNSNSVYGQSNTVQPPAYVVNVWRRTA